MFDWCSHGDHKSCKREVQRFRFDVVKGKSVLVMLDEWAVCECDKRGCKCFVPAKDRSTTPTGRKRKK